MCEADDHATIDALRAERPGPQFEIVEVPPAHPRTKPKALNYALAGARGEFVVIYDVEDHPHPDQLRAAYSQFATSPHDIVCLQAPLVISNGAASWITAAFASEYAALFRMLLPMLTRRRMPVPLGGTSNHLRVAVLRECGGWDPYNVTRMPILACGFIGSATSAASSIARPMRTLRPHSGSGSTSGLAGSKAGCRHGW
ncbi:glycosyltransferase [Rhizobium sp. R711]|uniref:glycosyltransferase n=1 Tax=unclassified Rhizobium TaxID=2613769 RepID=UPI0032AEB1E6